MEHTLLLLHGEEIIDSSGKNVPLTNQGAQASSAQSKFGGKSLYFDGQSGVYCKGFNFGLNAFTVDWWEYLEVNNTTGCSFCLNSEANSTPDFFTLYYAAGTIQLWTSQHNGSVLAEQVTKKWVHNALVREADKLTFYRDGVKTASYSYTIPVPNTSNIISVGFRYPYFSQAPQKLTGYIDEFRISDIARWTADFTPPTEPYGQKPDFSYEMQVPVGSSKKIYARLYPKNPDDYFQTDLTKATVDLTVSN